MEAAVGDDDDVVELADGDICEEGSALRRHLYFCHFFQADLIENEVVAEDDEEVVEPDLSVRTFTKHENPVFCVNLDPTDQEIVVSGRCVSVSKLLYSVVIGCLKGEKTT